jgi:predicted O-linked N-acetylglucosamine transferase (SPINDLY family)
LVNAGLSQFLAADLEGYVQKAVALANDPNTPDVLTELRSAMRDRLRAAPVCDAVGFARNMEAIYRRLCAERFAQQG